MTYLSILQPQANPYLLVRPHILMPGPFHLCILVILLRQSAGLNANYSSVPKMESLLNINRTVLRSLVLALRFPNLVIHFRQSANIKATHSRTKVKSFVDPPRMSSAASCLPSTSVSLTLIHTVYVLDYSSVPKPKHFPNITMKSPNNFALV